MRKAILALATALCMGTAVMPAAADEIVSGCIMGPASNHGWRYEPYSIYASVYSNYTPADCGYYDRRIFSGYIYTRIRYVRRHYR
jgi:hypothetical protein